MPSGPKKRRASKRKKGGIGNAGEEDNHESFDDQKAVDDIGSKESESVDIQTSLKENVKESEAVPVLDKSESTGNKDSESEVVDRIIRLQAPLIQPSPKNPEEHQCAQVGDGMKEGEGMSMEDVLKEPLEEPNERSSDEVVNTVDQSVVEVIPLNEAQDLSVPVKSVSETNVETNDHDSLGSSSLVDVFPVEDHGLLEMANHDVSVVKEGEDMSIAAVLHQDSPIIETSSHEPQEMVKPFVQSVLNKESEDPSPDIEVDVETIISFEDAQESFETPLGSPSLGYRSPVEGDVPFKGNWIEAMGDQMGSQVALQKEAHEHSLPVESVDVQTSLKDIQDSFKDSSLDDVSPAEGVVHEVDVESVLKENGDISMEGVLEEPIEHSSDAVVKKVYQWVLKVIPSLDNAEDHSVPVESLSEENVETSTKDVQDSSIKPLDDVAHVESIGVVQGVEVGESTLPDQPTMVDDVESVMKEDEDMSLKDVPEEPQKMVKTVDQLLLDAILLKEAQEASVEDKSVIEVNVETSFKDAHDSSKLESTDQCCSNETQAEVVLKEIPLEEAQLIESSLKDAQGSFKEHLGDSSMDEVSHVEGTEVGESETIKPFELGREEDEEMSIDKSVVEESFQEPIGHSSSHDQHEERVKSVNQSFDCDPSVPVESVTEVNLDTSFKDVQDSFESSSMVDVSPVGNKYSEVDESASHDSPTMVKHAESVIKEDEEMYTKGVIDEPFEEPIARSSSQPQSIVKTVNQDPSVDSSMDDMSPVKGTEITEVGESAAAMANHFESVKKEDEEMCIEDVHEEEPNVCSSSEQQIMVKTIDQQSVPKVKEAKDTSVSTEAVNEANVETSSKDPSLIDVFHVEGNGFIEVDESTYHGPPAIVYYVDSILKEGEEKSKESVLEEAFSEDNGLSSKDVQDSFNEPLGSSSFVEGVNNVESVMKVDQEMSMKGQDSFKKSMGGSSLVDVSFGQWNGQQNDMIGLAKTLLEEIRRIRAFYEEGLRQTTQIHLQMLQALENFESGKS